jgi:REP element-mobilizing transposase RayT
MPRQLRIEYEGAIYHVMNRGDRREPIFHDDFDRKRFVATLGEACVKTGWQVHGYCLMNNHFHLVIETPDANLVAGMRWFLSTYTARFNRRHKLFGHLFRGRYKSLIVEGSGTGYLRTVCDYVHLNPVRAKLLSAEQSVRDYVWSSWPEYLKAPEQRPRWLRVDRLLGEHSIPQDSVAGRAELENDLEVRRAAEDPDELKRIRRGWCLGTHFLLVTPTARLVFKLPPKLEICSRNTNMLLEFGVELTAGWLLARRPSIWNGWIKGSI